jgi:ATP diphosphatase
MTHEVARYSLPDLLRIMQRLRDPENGCPWDLAQDFQSIVPSTLEECYELAAAIEAGDYPHVADELGDVLFQVVFYAQLAEEQALFSFEGIVHGLAEKLLRRHPHVFADGEIEAVVTGNVSSERVKQQWEAIKSDERSARDQHGALDDVPIALPALPRAQKLQKRAARVGFDWPDAVAVMRKVDEETQELQDAIAADDPRAIEEELGDLMFTLVNLSRHLKVDAESALRRASSKFERRFRTMERLVAEDGSAESTANRLPERRRLDDCDSVQLEQLWERAKQQQ